MNRIILALAVALVAGCSKNEVAVTGDGVPKTETRSVTDFSRIEAKGSFQIQWSPGKPGLSIATDQNLLPLITSEVANGLLRIEERNNLHATKGTVIVISSPALTAVQLGGDMRFKGGQFSGDELKLVAAGNTDVSLEGKVATLTAMLTGDGKLDAKSLGTRSVDLSVVGNGQADVASPDTLKVSIIGDGSVSYAGNPKIDKSTIGSGRVEPRK